MDRHSRIVNQWIHPRRIKFRNDISGDVANSIPCFMWFLMSSIIVIIIILIISFGTKKRKIKVLSVISIIVLSSILAWAVIDYNNRVREENYWQHVATYDLTIFSNSTQNYSLIVPYLMDPKLQLETKITKGTGRLDFVQVNGTPRTLSPESLKVAGHDNITIHGSVYLNSTAVMSMADNSTSYRPDYWIFCEKTNENQNISLLLKCYQGGRHWISGIDMNDVIYIEAGWNRIKIHYDNVVP